MPAAGLGEKFVREALGLDRAGLHAQLPALGSPRDYSWPPQALGYVFTAEGVRRLVELLHLEIDVIEELAEAGAPRAEPAAPRHHHHGERANGYQPED